MLTEFQRDSDATENLKSRTAFTYDALNRLTGSTRRLEVYPYDTLAYAYTYDTLGNLLKQSGPAKGEEDTYQYNDLNQMVSKHVCGYLLSFSIIQRTLNNRATPYKTPLCYL